MQATNKLLGSSFGMSPCVGMLGGWLPDTLLGFETTSPRSHLVGGGCRPWGSRVAGGSGVFVVALLWWWGVVFDLWIVVASI